MRTNDSASELISDLAMAEASAWLTRLQDPRCATDKAAFSEWLASNPAHARAFARVSDIWELIPGAMAPSPQSSVAARQRPRQRRRPWLVAAACAAVVMLAVAVLLLFGPPTTQQMYQTAVGQQKTITLADNTQITLNTDTRIVVEYRQHERRVNLEHGEALFQVTKNQQRPFILQTGDQQIVDLGTVFDVSHVANNVAVTLLEGKVWVLALADAPGVASHPTVLEPGERLTVDAGGRRMLDRPDVQDVTAWQHGRLYFSDTSLADAIRELGRYGGTGIRLNDPGLESLRISGVFSTHDPEQFADAVAALHNLHVQRRHDSIVLSR